MKRFLLVLSIALCAGMTAAAQHYQEVVYLKNGSVIKGTVLEQEAGGNIKIKTADGSIFVYRMDEVQKVVKEESGRKASASRSASAVPPGSQFRGWRFSPGLGITSSLGEHSMASGVVDLGVGKDVSEQLYFGGGAQIDIPFQSEAKVAASAFLENRIYFPSSSKVSFLLRDRLILRPDFNHGNNVIGLSVMPGAMFPVTPSMDLMLSAGYQLGILLKGGQASHSVGFCATLDFHGRGGLEKKPVVYHPSGLEIGGSLGVIYDAFNPLDNPRQLDPMVALSVGYRFNPHLSIGVGAETGIYYFHHKISDSEMAELESEFAFTLTGRYRVFDRKWSPVVAVAVGTLKVGEYLESEEKAGAVLFRPSVGYSLRTGSGNGHLEFMISPELGVSNPFWVRGMEERERFTMARPLISVSYYHTLGIGSGLFKNVSLPSLRR